MTASTTVDPAGLLTPQRIVEAALSASTADGCVVVVHSSDSANIRWANNTVTTNGDAVDLSWFVVAVVDGAAATVAGSASDAASTAAVAEVVSSAHAAAVNAARLGPARDAQPLVGPWAGAAEDFQDPPQRTSFAVFDSLVSQLADAFAEARSAGRVLYGFVDHDVTTTYLGSSTGLRLRWAQPTGTLEINAKSADLRRSVWSGLSTGNFGGVDLAALLDPMTRRLDWARRTVDLPPGRYRTVLPPTAVADFMISLAWSAGAREAHEGRSAFAAPGGGTRSGERLTGLALDLFSDPARSGLAAAPFVVAGRSSDDISVFDNGAPIGRHDFVTGGRIGSLLHTRGSAAEFGEPFLPSADNLLLTGGSDRDIDALVGDVDRGLLLTSQWYIREVDPMTLLLTGLTRDGVYLVEHGEVVGAVNNFRFNMSPLDVLRQAVDVGATVPTLSREWSDWFTRTAMPPITVDGFNMSSVSPAT